jgi:hypothetical protein
MVGDHVLRAGGDSGPPGVDLGATYHWRSDDGDWHWEDGGWTSELTLRSGEAGCPYTGLTGSRDMAYVRDGRTWRGGQWVT